MNIYLKQMSSFKFNFSGASEINSFVEETPEKKDGNPKTCMDWLESDQIHADPEVTKNIDNLVQHANMFVCGDVEIGHVIVSEALKSMNDGGKGIPENIFVAEKGHSDLVAGQYEGGLKIWECTSDLIDYLQTNLKLESWSGANVLDVGCGAGMLGIMALKNGANVCFQDYNKEVLKAVTIPNVLLNLDEDERQKVIHNQCTFFSGDWASFNKLTSKQPEDESYKFDFILSSETIYNEENYSKLINLFRDRLKSDGEVYVAAKTYYFGVGGGTRQFETEIKKDDSLVSEVCWKSSDRIQREIIKITKISNKMK